MYPKEGMPKFGGNNFSLMQSDYSESISKK